MDNADPKQYSEGMKMHRTHNNSTTAYSEIIETLPRSRRAVFECIVICGDITRQGIADSMGIPINRVTGRVRELLDASQIEESGVVYVDKKPRAVLSAVKPDDQLNMF